MNPQWISWQEMESVKLTLTKPQPSHMLKPHEPLTSPLHQLQMMNNSHPLLFNKYIYIF
jgi:hypothetical protein